MHILFLCTALCVCACVCVLIYAGCTITHEYIYPIRRVCFVSLTHTQTHTPVRLALISRVIWTNESRLKSGEEMASRSSERNRTCPSSCGQKFHLKASEQSELCAFFKRRLPSRSSGLIILSKHRYVWKANSVKTLRSVRHFKWYIVDVQWPHSPVHVDIKYFNFRFYN